MPNELNGDCCKWLEHGHVVVLALADGVGSCASDSRASKTTCILFIDKCSNVLSEGLALDEQTLFRICKEIDPVLAVDDDMACFCAVVWRTDENKVTWLHVGDTRIYKYSKAKGLIQMTQDDHGKAVNVKIGGKLYTDHGAVVSATPIDNAIGDRNCNYHTGVFDFLPGESIVLCSDGMYNSSTFSKDVETLLNEADMTSGAKRITTTDDDDNSLVIVRRDKSVADTVTLRELMENFEQHQADMPFNALIDRFANELETQLNSNFEVNEIAKMVAFMKAHQLYPDRTRIERIFGIAVKKLNSMQDIPEKQCFNNACGDLKDILRYVFTH